MAQYCTFSIVRHGETEWNRKGLIQGHEDSPLTLLGTEQAKQLGAELQHLHFDAAFSSDLLRAKRTAEIMLLERKVIVQTTALLRERAFGKYEGQPHSSVKAIEELFETLSEEEIFRYKDSEDVESDEEIITRFITFIREVAVALPGKKVLVATHSGIMRAFLIHLGVATYKNFGHNHISNTAYITLDSDGVDFFVRETKGIELSEGKST